MAKPPIKSITISLDDYIVTALGSERRGCVSIPMDAALVVHALVKNELMYYVQFVTPDNEPLENPILWSYPEWHESDTNYKRLKAWSDRRRVEEAILERNTLLVARKLVELTGMDFPIAKATANVMLHKKKFKNAMALGVKLITKEEEL